MKQMVRLVATLALLLVPAIAFAQLNPVILEAESGTIGSQFTVASDGSTTYATIQSTVGGFNPGSAERVISFNVTFPHDGIWELYARVRVGPATFNDDSMYYARTFGVKNPALDADWVLANGLAGNVGFTNPTDKVTGGGIAASQVWKWVKLSAFDGGAPPVAGFSVSAGSLTQTFQIAGREDGLWIDKIAFGPQGVFFTVFNLDNGQAGTTEPPPPPYVPPGPPIATGKPKFLGGVSSPSQNLNFTAYFNQVTPENGGKWGSVEGTRNVMTWGELDTAYNLAKNNGFPFRMHTLIWGNQQPNWIAALPVDQQRAEIEEWFAAVATRYPDIDFIDVVNEPLHDPPDDAADGGYINALGGTGATGWDWVIESFRLARQYFPHAKLGINDFSITNTPADTTRYIGIIELLKRVNLIDTIGVQGHAFSTRGDMATHTMNLNRLAATGLPIYVTELDIDGPTDEIQLADYQRIFPTFWKHPAVRGITLWGYRPGHWRTAQGAYIVHQNGAERPAMVWLKEYVAATELAPWVAVQPTATTATVGDNVSFTCQIFGAAPLGYEWRLNGTTIGGNPSASTATLQLAAITTAAAGTYTCVVAHASGSTTSIPATLTVNKAQAIVTLSGLTAVYDGTPKPVTVATVPPGLPVLVSYNGSATPPTAPGSYAVVAAVNSPDYFGSASGTLVITTTALSRHAPLLAGRLDGSVHLLLPETTSVPGGAVVTGDILVPGTPQVVLKGAPAYGGTLDGTGNPSPSGYIVTLAGDASVRHVVRATDPVAMPAVPAPPSPAGTRDVVLAPGDSVGDFATLRNLTVKSSVGQVAVPPRTYGAFLVNSGSGLTLGVAGSIEPSVYNLQSLSLRAGSSLQVVGPVVLNVAGAVTVTGAAGNASAPEWLTINVASGGVTVSAATLNGYVTAPAGVVTIKDGGAVIGGVRADQIALRFAGTLRQP